jgi:hypothetical protein
MSNLCCVVCTLLIPQTLLSSSVALTTLGVLGGEADEGGSAADSTDMRFKRHLDRVVAEKLARCDDRDKAAAATSTQVKQYRDGLILNFLQQCAMRRKCMLCQGKDRRLLARSSTMVLALQLAPKDRKRMELLMEKLEFAADR